ncbi:madf domain transcription factor [Holotrichia oblita]|uniref:Madf domain transcription factor n=1 Tax=Holotrichia oblita TaxID=644536 RepID=A0ACB9SKF3_HOLOL|nr:madf domain transcription factor [Holotrichia oblita]
MKVSIAAQVFSHSVVAVINVFIEAGTGPGREVLGASALGTVKLLKFVDNMFDSVNGSRLYQIGGKTLRCAMLQQCGHHAFFEEVPPSLTNLLVTLYGLEDIFNNLEAENVSLIKLRNVNQDPVENFFGKLRLSGARNVNPTTVQFKNHYKSLIINNLTSKHSINANSKDDVS